MNLKTGDVLLIHYAPLLWAPAFPDNPLVLDETFSFTHLKTPRKLMILILITTQAIYYSFLFVQTLYQPAFWTHPPCYTPSARLITLVTISSTTAPSTVS